MYRPTCRIGPGIQLTGYPNNAGIDFRRHNLTSVDVRLCRLKSTPRCKSKHMYNDRRPMTYFRYSSEKADLDSYKCKKKPLVSMVYINIFQRCKG